MDQFETPTPIAPFLHMEDNQDGTCTMTICMDGVYVMTTLIELSLIEYYKLLVAENGEYADRAFEFAMELHDSGKITEIPSDIGDS